MSLSGMIVVAAVAVPPGHWVVNHAHPGHYTQPTVRHFERGPVDRYREQSWHCYVDTLDRLWADYRLAGSSREAWETYKVALANARRAYVYQDPYYIGQSRYGAWNPAWDFGGACGCPGKAGYPGCHLTEDQPTPAEPEAATVDPTAGDDGVETEPASTSEEPAAPPAASAKTDAKSSAFRLASWPHPVARAVVGTARAAAAIARRIAHPFRPGYWRHDGWHAHHGYWWRHGYHGYAGCARCGSSTCTGCGAAACATDCGASTGSCEGDCQARASCSSCDPNNCSSGCGSCGGDGRGTCGHGAGGCGIHGCGYGGYGRHCCGWGYGNGYYGYGRFAPWASPHAGPTYFGPLRYSYYHPSKLAWGEPLSHHARGPLKPLETEGYIGPAANTP